MGAGRVDAWYLIYKGEKDQSAERERDERDERSGIDVSHEVYVYSAA